MKTQNFKFDTNTIAQAYDTVLVPILFKSWAQQLIKDLEPWHKQTVIDLAAGTGIITNMLEEQNKNLTIYAVDMNGQMLNIAKKHCANAKAKITFIESDVESMDIPDNSADIVICQQGFQFFPNKLNAAKKIKNVLKPGGKAVISTWKPVEECQFFGAICHSLETMNEHDISNLMRLPFDFMSASALKQPFTEAGFNMVNVTEQQKDLIVPNGVPQAIELAYATPIGPQLKAFSIEKSNAFKSNLMRHLKTISKHDKHLGHMTSLILTAHKPI
ncbi:class I SAM-dependent methyltransferase [Snuella sedimenti]|uniref:Methyltransferase domain-containing protein n=1 Tax=Snuella sedimenti TaxID=2798802 RepID=A0A8J7LXN5_9FLAO|nr:class I SAM-dependent methyltransferase [Snuella sedimenti]MBJ6367046.1 methyltransferase domain-containing protein [Snuella sedimenti]